MIELLDRTGIPEPRQTLRCLPAHAVRWAAPARDDRHGPGLFSPKLLIADEPTTALDVTIQAQILELLEDLQKEFSMAVLLITHDLNLVRRFADRVCVMQKGQMVEQGGVARYFLHRSMPTHGNC